MEHTLEKYRSREQQVEVDKKKLLVIRIGFACSFVFITIFQIKNNLIGNFQYPIVIVCQWIFFSMILLAFLYQHFWERPNLIRVLHILMIFRIIITLNNFEGRKPLEDLAIAALYNLWSNFSILF